MKVTYTKNRFEIDGVIVINPEVLPVKWQGTFWLWVNVKVDDGMIFDLPENIATETEYAKYVGEWVFCTKKEYEMRESSYIKKEIVYRLKLKEPLVETGSKEMEDLLLLKSWFEKHYPKDMPYCPFNWAGIIDRAVESITRK